MTLTFISNSLIHMSYTKSRDCLLLPRDVFYQYQIEQEIERYRYFLQILRITCIFADGLLGNPRHFGRKKRYAHSCSLKM